MGIRNIKLPRFSDSISMITYGFLFLNILVIFSITGIKISSKRSLKQLLREIGIQKRKIQRVIVELERKSIHLVGVVIPLTYQTLSEELGEKLSWEYIFKIGWFITCTIWVADLTRTNFGLCRKHWPLQKYMRLKERKQITGMCFCSLGCSIVLTFFPPYIAQLSILFLVLGDLSAALFGVAFGKESFTMKLGRE